MINPYAPPLTSVRDIAEPHTATAPADRGTRLGAAILDGLIFAAMVYVPLFVVAIIGGIANPETGDNTNPLLAVGLLLAVIGFALWCWLTIVGMKANGQSIAKKMLGIKVVRTDGSPVSLGRLIWLRNVVNTLVGIIPLYGLIDPLFIFQESRRCLHDKLADTIVIKA